MTKCTKSVCLLQRVLPLIICAGTVLLLLQTNNTNYNTNYNTININNTNNINNINNTNNINYISAVNKENLSVLWYTNLEQGLGSYGFYQESLNFMLPLYNLLNFGWFAASSISDVRTNRVFNELPEPDKAIMLDLFIKGAQIGHEMLYRNNAIAITFEQPRFYKEVFEKTRMKYSIYKVGRAMFETDWIPHNWEYLINEYLDELWVPSNFAKKVFQSAGVYKPIKVIGEGFDTTTFSRVLNDSEKALYRKQKYSKCLESDVIFLYVGKGEQRKGMDILLKAWIAAFSKDNPACLYIRASINDEITPENKKLLTTAQQKGLRIYDQKKLSYEDLVIFYQSADVFVLPSHGEGWGRPIMEAMAAGLAVIVPLWSGVTEFVKEDYSVPLHVTALEPAFRLNGATKRFGGARYKDLHRWATINTTELRNLLFWCSKHPQEIRIIGSRAREAMYASYTREKIAKVAKVRIDEIKSEIGERGVEFYQKKSERKRILWEEEAMRESADSAGSN